MSTILLCFCHYLARSEVCKGCQSHVTLDINLPIASVDLRFFCLANIFSRFHFIDTARLYVEQVL